MTPIQTAFLALHAQLAKAGVHGETEVTISFDSRRDQAVFESQLRFDGIGFDHKLFACEPHNMLKPGVAMRIAGIDIKLQNREPPYYSTYDAPRHFRPRK